MTPLLAALAFVHPESVLPYEGALYVSDIGAFGVGGDGAVYRVRGDSTTLLAGNLGDPKGMAVSHGYLYVTDVDRIWKVDSAGALSLAFAPGAFPSRPAFLNDLCADAAGYLYVSDTFGDAVYKATTLGEVIELAALTAPNGLACAPDGTLYVVTFTEPGNVYALKDGSPELIGTSATIDKADGCALVGNTLYISAYDAGRLVAFDLATRAFTVVVEGLTTPADIAYDNGAIVVPSLESGKILRVPLK